MFNRNDSPAPKMPQFPRPPHCRALRAVLGSLMLGAILFAPVSGQAPVAGKKARPTKIRPTGPLPRTTEQLIAPATLSKDTTGSLMVLHVNDMHEILKAPAKGLGGLAYVAGFANQMRARRPDTLFMDAGDILQKGDAMSRLSQGEASYRVLGAIGLDCTVPGNHDFNYGFENFLKNTKLVNLPIICAGLAYDDTKESVLPEMMIKQIGSLKVGLIGATISRPIRGAQRQASILPPAEMGKRIDELAQKMEPQVDLTVLILHNGTWAGKMLAKAAPNVDLVITGHTNEVTTAPLKAETGALVVGVGRAGQWVGTLDLVVDRDQKKIGQYTYEMIPMDHKKIQPDAKVAELVDALDRKWSAEGTTAQTPPAPAAKGKKGAFKGKKGAAQGQRKTAPSPQS